MKLRTESVGRLSILMLLSLQTYAFRKDFIKTVGRRTILTSKNVENAMEKHFQGTEMVMRNFQLFFTVHPVQGTDATRGRGLRYGVVYRDRRGR